MGEKLQYISLILQFKAVNQVYATRCRNFIISRGPSLSTAAFKVSGTDNNIFLLGDH